MPTELDPLLGHLLTRLRQVQQTLGMTPAEDSDGDSPLSGQVDSMGLVEFVALVADDCGVSAATIERSVSKEFSTVRSLAEALTRAGLNWPGAESHAEEAVNWKGENASADSKALCWLSGPTLRLPATVQTAEELDRLLDREPGWFIRHAGIAQRHVWGMDDPIAAATEAGSNALREVGLLAEEVGAVVVTSEAPPLLAGLGAALHHRLNFRPQTVTLEVGGACTGFLTAVWLARFLLPELETVLLVCLEAPSLHLALKPGAGGEAAALFGDGAAACVVSRRPTESASLPVLDLRLQSHGAVGECLRVQRSDESGIELAMDGQRLATVAIEIMAEQVFELAEKHALSLKSVPAVLAHGGNGRMPGLLARRLHLPEERVWSQTPLAGNLGSASLLATWAANRERIRGPVLWTGVGAGLASAAALTGQSETRRDYLEL